MTKFKKLAMIVVSTVMAGTMLMATACNDTGNNPGGNEGDNSTVTPPPGGGDDPKPTPGGDKTDEVEENFTRGDKPAASSLSAGVPNTKSDGYTLDFTGVTSIKTALGYKGGQTGIAYEATSIHEIGGTDASNIVVAGRLYTDTSLKPAWQALSDKLGLKFEDNWIKALEGAEASKMISTIKQKGKLSDYAFITASADTISTEQAQNSSFLNINEYLYYMPNYKAFLDSNPVVQLSLTHDSATGAMYMLPYFDGNDDIEKYVLMRKDVVEKILNATDLSAATTTFAQQAAAKNSATAHGVASVVGNKSSVKSFMGTTGNYKISVTDPSVMVEGAHKWGSDLTAVSDSEATVEILVDYDAALKAAKDDATPLGAAVKDAAGKKYDEASGNIIDLQNFAINAKSGAVTGAQLTKILQEYIKVAYHKDGDSNAFYTKLSDVFNSAYAAWDVDLYVALGRCAMTSLALCGDSVRDAAGTYFLGSRGGATNRTYDVASMAGELYGIRGLTSRNPSLYSYIDANGFMQDARADAATWEALANMHDLALEGLYYTGTAQVEGFSSIAGETNVSPIQFLSSTDYVQTQTAKGGFVADGTVKGSVEEGYNYAPILTPISKWNVGTAEAPVEKIMRFTESWRGVKDGGFVVPIDYVKGDGAKLAAVLAFIDYFFSNDGQILMTYGPQSLAGNVTRAQGSVQQTNNQYGTWYGNAADITFEQAKEQGIVGTYDGEKYFVKKAYKDKYFCYNNNLYTGTFYNGKQIPTMTDENLDIFYKVAGQNFTNHARYYLGSCLNLGVKDQGFEYQCTSKCGLAGADIWAIAANNGTIEHTVQTIDIKTMWYTLVPTVLPFTKDQTSAMADQYKNVSGKGGDGENYFYANSKATANLLTDIMYYGFDNTKTITAVKTSYPNTKIPTSADGVVTLLNSAGLDKVDGFMSDSWLVLLNKYMTENK